MTNVNWPFQDPPNVAVISTIGIVRGGKAILRVTHDEDDGAWQFLEEQPVSEDEGLVVSLRTMVKLDESISELADLPLGWIAQREAKGKPWFRAKRVQLTS